MSEGNREGIVIAIAMLVLIAPVAIIGVVHMVEPPPVYSDDADEITIGERRSIWSDVLDEDREYLVWLPGSYHDVTYMPRDYPVLYLLDGDTHFHSTTGIVQYMSGGDNGNYQVPEMIVVAIPNTDRTRDLTPTHSTLGLDGTEFEVFESSGGADDFLRFLDEELIPDIDGEYRTLSYRTLVGHSFGGLFAAHAMLSEPDLFDAYVAIDPSLWWDDEMMLQRAEEAFADGHDQSGHIYISIADTTNPEAEDDPRRMENGIRRFAEILGNANNESFRSDYFYYDAEDHGSVPLLSLYHGLLDIFDGYKAAYGPLREDPNYLITHYEAISARLGVALVPPEKRFDDVGYYFLEQSEEIDKAITAFEINVTNNPGSWHAYDSLAAAYLANGDEALAIETYERSLELNPDNDNARERIEAIRNPTEAP